MESSVPLLAVKYLPWRSTLYTAVCQCYYDCKAGQHAEVHVHAIYKPSYDVTCTCKDKPNVYVFTT